MKRFMEHDYRFSHTCLPHLNLSPDFIDSQPHCKADLASLCRDKYLVDKYLIGSDQSGISQSISEVCGFKAKSWQNGEVTTLKVRLKIQAVYKMQVHHARNLSSSCIFLGEKGKNARKSMLSFYI